MRRLTTVTYNGYFVQRGFAVVWEPKTEDGYRTGWVLYVRLWRTVYRWVTNRGAEKAWKQVQAAERA